MRSTRLRVLGGTSAVVGAVVMVGAVAAAADLDPRTALTAPDQATARKIVLQRGDLGAGWQVVPMRLGNQPLRSSVCPGFNPDLSRLTIQGQAGSRATDSGAQLSAVTEALLLANRAQARAINRALAAPFVRKCFRPGTSRGGAQIDSVTQDSFVRSDALRFRVRMTLTNSTTWFYGDYVFLQTGRAWVTIVFASTGKAPPTAIEKRALATVSRRIHG